MPSDTSIRQGVVVACRRADGRWLLVKRAKTLQRAPGKVGFPGGIIEAGETQPQAAVREMREELGAAIEPIGKFWEKLGDVPGFLLHGWYARLLTSIDQLTPDPAEVEAILWLTENEAITHPDAFAGNASYIAALRDAPMR